MQSQSVLSVENLTVAYREKVVLDNVNLDISSGVIQAIVGPNGAGKSTLLKAALELIPVREGRVSFFGGSLRENRVRVAYVPQRASVDWDFPATVWDVAIMGTYGLLGWFRRPKQAEKQRTHEALERVGLGDLKQRQIGQLSGGQQQRVFLARALAQNADLYLMDEPFQGVDAVTEKAIVEILHDLRTSGKTLVVVHHDLQTVKTYFDAVTLLNRKVLASGVVETAFTSENIMKTYTG